MHIYNRPLAHIKGLTSLVSKRSKLIAIVSMLWLVASPSSMASDYDSSIIKEGLSGIVCKRNLAVIVEGAYFQNTPINKPKKKPERHFETEKLEKSFKYINSERKKVLNAALMAGPDPQMRTRCLFHFGMMVHTINSLYTNTSYLPDKIKVLLKSQGEVTDPYNIDLIDWSKNNPEEFQNIKWLSPKQRKKQFSKKIKNTSVARVARGLAIRETGRQWDFLEALIRSRYSSKADTIIAALKQAGCDKLVPEELEGLPLHAHAE